LSLTVGISGESGLRIFHADQVPIELFTVERLRQVQSHRPPGGEQAGQKHDSEQNPHASEETERIEVADAKQSDAEEL
jgi:hypothetical protein